MKKIGSIVVLTFAVFFMTSCGGEKDIEKDILPGIELIGNSVMEVEQYSEFIDPGADILGAFDLDVVITDDVNTNVIGDYTVTYTIIYLEIEYVVSRTVRVVELGTVVIPGLQLYGDAVVEVLQHSIFIDLGVDLIGDFSLDIDVVSDVDTSTIGTYTITYTITYMEIDYSLTRTVEVVMDVVETPVLTFNSHTCDIYEDEIDCDFSLNSMGFNSVDLYANLYEGSTFVDYYYIDYDNYYYFYDLDASTEYIVYVYADYNYGGVDYYDVLIGTYVYTTLEAVVYYPPVIENVVITKTTNSVTVEFDVTDEHSSMYNGTAYLIKGSSSSGQFDIDVGHNSFTYDSYIYENTLYSFRVNVDYKGDGQSETLYEEDVYTPPVITVNSFEQTEMFYANDYIIMKLDIENDEEVEIDFVTINGIRYSTFVFPSTLDVLYIDLGVQSSAGNYVMTLGNVVITQGDTEVIIDLTASDDVSVYIPGTMVPTDATVRVIDIIPVDYYVHTDNDNQDEITSINVSIYLDNKYNLPVSSIMIGGVVYSGGDLTTISSNELLISAKFSRASGNSSNLYFNQIIFTRNGEVVTDNQADPVYVGIYEIFNNDWDASTPEVIHVSTPEDLMDVQSDSIMPSRVFVLDNDIDMSGYDFVPIGTFDNEFTGAFDGNGFTISNVTINKSFGVDNELNYVGLFGYSLARITNLTIDNLNITISTSDDNHLYVGVLAGRTSGSVYEVNVYNSSITIDGVIHGNVGGLVGYSRGDLVRSSADTEITIVTYNDADSSMSMCVGGLVGNKAYKDVRNSYASGDISMVFSNHNTVFVGGLLGISSGSDSIIINSYATGDINTTADYYSRIGGLIGDSYNSTVENSYASGDIHSTAGTIGGLIGEAYGEIKSSFAVGTVIGDNGTIGKLFGKANEYKFDLMYKYEGQLAYYDTTPTNGTDTFYSNIGVASSLEFNNTEYYTDFLGWYSHFFDFSNLDIENGYIPVFVTD